MTVGKHHNPQYSTGLPLAVGDRYYGQDLFRDFRYLQDLAGLTGMDLSGMGPFFISGGVVTQGAGLNLNITLGVGYAAHSVDIVDSYSSLPPTTTTADIAFKRIAWSAQTNMNASSSTCAAYVVVDDGATVQYVKVRYYELDGQTRTRAKKAGTYACEVAPAYKFYIDATPPTAYEVCLCTFTSAAGTYTFSAYTTHWLNYRTLKALSDELYARELGKRPAPRRQTVLDGAVDANNAGSFIATVAGLKAKISASTGTPVTCTWANGDEAFPFDYTYKHTADFNWTTLTDYATPKLYVDYNAGTPAAGESLYCPVYGQEYWGIWAEAICSDFEGTDGDVTFKDDLNVDWSFVATARIESDHPKFGTTSVYLPVAADAVYCPAPKMAGKWTIEFWCRMDNAAAVSAALCDMWGAGEYGIQIRTNSGGTSKLGLYLSSDGASWDIANNSLGAKTSWNNNQYYHFSIVFTGAAYKVYVDGTVDITVTSSTAVTQPYRFQLGALGSGYGNGDPRYYDDFVFYPYAKRTANFTAPIAANVPETQHWFDTVSMTMNYGTPAAWTKCNRLFVGEVSTDGSNSSSAVTYAIRGKYESPKTAVPNVLTNLSFTHNMGTNNATHRVYAVCIDGEYGYSPGDIILIAQDGNGVVLEPPARFNRLTGTWRSGASSVGVGMSLEGDFLTIAQTKWKLIYRADRSF